MRNNAQAAENAARASASDARERLEHALILQRATNAFDDDPTFLSKMKDDQFAVLNNPPVASEGDEQRRALHRDSRALTNKVKALLQSNDFRPARWKDLQRLADLLVTRARFSVTAAAANLAKASSACFRD